MAGNAGWRADFARRWALAITSSTHVPMAFEHIQSALSDTLDGLLAAIIADPFPADEVIALGAGLVQRHLVAQATVRQILAELGDEVLVSPTFAGVPRLASRVLAAVCACAAGYAQELRHQTYEQQEHIRAALVRAHDDARRELVVTESRFRELFNSSATGIAISDLDGVLVQSNPALQEILGYSEEEVSGMRVGELLHPGDRDVLVAAYQDVLSGRRDRFRCKARLVHADGDTVWARVAGTVLRDADGGPGYQVTMVEDNTDLQLTQQELNNQALHDNLTGLPNRQFFVSRLETVLAQANAASTIAVCHMALDGLTAVNAGLGHSVGDRLLQIVAQRLEALMSAEAGMVARFSGGEFTLFVIEDDQRPDVMSLVERIRDRVSEPAYLEGHAVTTTASIAVVERAALGLNARDLLRDAGLALHRVKATARGQWDLFDSDRDTGNRARLTLAATIPGALDEGALELRYQPMVRLSDKAIVGVAPVIEWDRPGERPVGHDELIELAQQSGFIGRLGRWLLAESCKQAAEWHIATGRDLPPLVVRLTGQQSQDPDLVGQVWAALDSTGLPASGLRIGLRADAVLGGWGDSVDNAETLAAMGVEVLLHDVDRLDCTLHEVGRLPIDVLEVSPSVLDCATGPESNPVAEQVVRGLIEVTEGSAVTVAAVGVRTADQAGWIAGRGVEIGQGDAFAPPMPPDDLIDQFR